MNRLHRRSIAIFLALAGCGFILAQNSNPNQKGATKFGLPSAKPDNSGKNVVFSNSPTPAAAASSTIANKSGVESSTNWGSVSRILVTFEGSRQGKFKATTKGGTDSGSECLSYVLQPQPGPGLSEKPSTTIHKLSSITITKESDAATGQLLRALEDAEPMKTVTFEFVEEGPRVALKATLLGASIVSIQQHFDTKTRGVFEDVTLNFTKIEFQ